MDSLFLNYNFWIALSIICFIVILLLFILKFEPVRWVLSVILVLGLVSSSVYCLYQIDGYYSAEGGIYGILTGNVNSELSIDDGVFNFTYLEFKKTENVDEYIIEVEDSKVYSLDLSKKYVLEFNGQPCVIESWSSDYLTAHLTYNFYGSTGDIVQSDTLFFEFIFTDSNTIVRLITKGGDGVICYWYTYFSRHECTALFKLVDSVYQANN